MLDIFFVWDGNSITFYQHTKNLSMIISENLQVRKNFKYPLFTGIVDDEQIRKFSVELSGRRARWTQLGLHENLGSLSLSIAYDLLELRMHGFPTSFAFTIWYKQRGDQTDREIALKMIPTMFSAESSKALSLIHI